MGLVNSLAFPKPPKEWSEQELQSAPEFLWVPLQNQEGSVPALHIKRSPDTAANFTLLYSHGNAEDIGLSLDYLRDLSAQCDCDVFAAEYVGYSISPGEPSEEGCYASINAAFEYLINGPAQLQPSQIVPFGRSLGSGPTVDLVSRHPEIRGMVLLSGLESGARAIFNKAVSFVGYPLDIFRNYMKIDRVQARTLVIHGTNDNVVPWRNGHNIYSALQQRGLAHEPLWLEGRGHNDIPPEPCFRAIRGLLDVLDDGEGQPAPSEARLSFNLTSAS